MRDHGRPIVFIDFDGTICHDRYWRNLAQGKQDILQAHLFQKNRHIVYEWMRGLHTAEAINGIVAAALDMSYDELWAIFVADCRSMHVSPATLARITRLRAVAYVVLITGNMDSFSRFTVPALGLDRYFDAISNSFSEGRLKTDDSGTLFVHYADRFSASIGDCLVIDDSEEVCSTFAHLGGTPLLATPERTADTILDNLLLSWMPKTTSAG